jgi:hypothetical protein
VSISVCVCAVVSVCLVSIQCECMVCVYGCVVRVMYKQCLTMYVCV